VDVMFCDLGEFPPNGDGLDPLSLGRCSLLLVPKVRTTPAIHVGNSQIDYAGWRMHLPRERDRLAAKAPFGCGLRVDRSSGYRPRTAGRLDGAAGV
jgi:hypothetical protein